MSPLQNLAVLALAILACLSGLAVARDLPPVANSSSLGARLAIGVKDGDGLVDCWNALLELRSCTNEIVLFFLNGESYLTLDCCRAIRTITHHCWPAMLTSLGFTAEEGDILRGDCDAETAAAPPAPEPSASASRAATANSAVFGEMAV